MKNVGIFGIGAIGSLITKYISSNQKNNYFFFNRSDKDRISIQFEDQLTDIPINTSTNKNQQLDWLIVCLKEYHFDKAKEQLKELIDDSTKIAIFQNGIKLSDRYQNFTHKNKILETIIDCPVQQTTTDKLLQLKIPKIILPQHSLTKEFIQLFDDSPIEFKTTEKFKKSQWIKLIESSSIGSIQCMTGQPCSTFDDPKRLQEFIELVEEGITVALSEGIHLDSDLNSQLLTKLKNYPRSKGSSMLSDKLNGRELELGAKIGVIIDIAKKNNIEVPTTQKIHHSLAT